MKGNFTRVYEAVGALTSMEKLYVSDSPILAAWRRK